MTDDEYTWMFEQILSLQREGASIPHGITSLSLDDKHACMDLVGKCNSCETENEWRSVRLFIAESLACVKCGRRHYAPIPDAVADRVSENVEKLIAQYGRVCFWGVNSFFYSLCNKLRIADTGCVVCVDKSAIRHGLNILGGKLKPTEVIKHEKIGCVVVTVPQYYPSLAPSIKTEFPGVSKIVSIAELLSCVVAP